jgi:hypothetical protein
MSYVTLVGHRLTGCDAHTPIILVPVDYWPGQARAYCVFLVVDTHLYSVYQTHTQLKPHGTMNIWTITHVNGLVSPVHEEGQHGQEHHGQELHPSKQEHCSWQHVDFVGFYGILF